MLPSTIQFTSPLVGVTAGDANVVVLPPDQGKQAVRANAAELATTLNTIATRMEEIKQLVQHQRETVVQQALAHGLAIAQTVLQSDDELLEQRLSQQLKMACSELSAADGDDATNEDLLQVFVHPDHLQQAESLLADCDTDHWTASADASLAPGDCRVELGQTGLLAALGSQIDHVSTRLVAAGPNEGGRQ